MRSFFLGLALALFSLVPVIGHAQSGQRVVVERFRGPRAAHARSLLVRDLTDAGYVVVGDDELDGARRELGLGRELEASDYVALARSLHAAAFIDGRVGHAHRTWRLVCRVRNGADGSVLGSEGWGGRTQGAIDAVGRSGASQLREHLARAAEPAAPQPVDTETPWYAGGADAESATEAEGEGHFGEEEPVAEQPASTRYDSVRIAFSGGSLWRQMQAHAQVYAVRRGITAADPATALVDEARGYTSSGIGHAELGAEAEFYPGALGDQPFPYLGLIGSFRHSVLLSSSGCQRTSADCTGNGRVSVGTDQMDVQIGARFRYRLGADRRDVQLFGDVSYGYSSFTFDLGALQQLDYQAILPPMEYQWVGITAGFDYGLVPDALFLQIRGGYRIGVGIGTNARNVWGIDSTSQGGWDLSAELKHEANWLAQGIFVSLRFEFFQFMTSFRGQVGCATPGTCPDMPNTPWLDNSLWEPWPAQAGMPAHIIGGIRDTVPDNYFRWAIYIGYAFR
jgi:hypothetical protein